MASQALNNSSFEYDEHAVNADEGTGPSSGGGVLSDDNVTAESAKKIGKGIAIAESRSIGRHPHHDEGESHAAFFDELTHTNSGNNFRLKQADTDDDKEARAMTSADERIYSQDQKPPLMGQAASSQHNKQREQDCANLFSLTASQSIDSITPSNQDMSSVKGQQTIKPSQAASGGQQKQSPADKTTAGGDRGKGGSTLWRDQPGGAGKSNTNSSSRKSSRKNSKRANSNRQKSREEKQQSHSLIQQFVSHLVDQAVEIVKQSSDSEESAQRRESEEGSQKSGRPQQQPTAQETVKQQEQ